MQVRLANEHGASSAQPGYAGGVLSRHAMGVDLGGRRGAHAGRVVQVLESHRNAVQWSPIVAAQDLLLATTGSGQRLFAGHGNVGIERLIQGINALEVCLSHFHGRNLPVS